MSLRQLDESSLCESCGEYDLDCVCTERNADWRARALAAEAAISGALGDAMEAAKGLREEVGRGIDQPTYAELTAERDSLRAALGEALDMLDDVDWLTFPGGCELADKRIPRIAELRAVARETEKP